MPNTVIKEWAVACATHLNWRSAAVVVATTSVLLVGCSAAPDDRASTTATSEAPAARASTTATSEAPAAFPLEGAWQAGPISIKETEATVRRYGLGRWVEDYRANAPFSGDTVLTLTIEHGAWDLHGASGGGQSEPIDYDAETRSTGTPWSSITLTARTPTAGRSLATR